MRFLYRLLDSGFGDANHDGVLAGSPDDDYSIGFDAAFPVLLPSANPWSLAVLVALLISIPWRIRGELHRSGR